MVADGAAALGRWLSDQAARERRAARLEDALLGDRCARYFAYRLRLFALRTLIVAVIHAVRVLLLYGAFSRDQFLLVVLVAALAAVVGDAWWGALERMRGRIRTLQQVGSMHLVPREIASWLRLAAALTVVGLGVAAGTVVVGVVAMGGLQPALMLAAAVVVGAAVDLTVRAYHSGVYALRRVYRPLPSLIAVDVVGLAALLVLWPLLGAWAFPLAELVSIGVVTAISLHYITRTYRLMGLPTLPALLRTPAAAIPTPRLLRSALAPGLSTALVGLEAVVVITVAAAARPSAGASGATLVALLVALGPTIRAGFEWARLLYFDLVRLGLPLLAGLRDRFDRAVLRLALAVGAITWLMAAGIGVVVLGIREWGLIAVLLPFFVSRSLLAAAQVRSFAGGGYRRLSIVGIAAMVAFGGVLAALPDPDQRLLALSVILGVSAAFLVTLPEPVLPEDLVLPLATWLARLRDAAGPVSITAVRFDPRGLEPGTLRDRHEAEAWRRRQVGQRLGREARRAGGAAAWLSSTRLAWWLPVPSAAGRPTSQPGSMSSRASPTSRLHDPAWVVRLAGGLLVGPPRVTPSTSGDAAARDIARDLLRLDPDRADPPLPALVAEFERSFPGGIVHVAGESAPSALVALGSRERAGVLRAALRFVRDLDADPERGRFEVTALTADGMLRLLFLAPARAPSSARLRWRRAIRDRTLRAAIRGG